MWGLTLALSRRRYHQHERSTDFPARAVRFPDTADLSNVKASYVNGVLKLEVRIVPVQPAHCGRLCHSFAA